jgi:hypothetical protein
MWHWNIQPRDYVALPSFGRKAVFFFCISQHALLSILFFLEKSRTLITSFLVNGHYFIFYVFVWWTRFSHFNTWTFLSETQLCSGSLIFLFVSSSSSSLSPAPLPPPYFHVHQRTTLKFNKNLNEACVEVGNTKLEDAVSSVSQNVCCWSVGLLSCVTGLGWKYRHAFLNCRF